MGKILSAKKVKKLPIDTGVMLIDEKTGKAGRLWIMKIGRKKVLRGIIATHEIKDRCGWHYELPGEG